MLTSTSTRSGYVPTCKFFAKGVCKRGRGCKFSHQAEHPLYSTVGDIRSVSGSELSPHLHYQDNVPSRLDIDQPFCKFFEAGICSRGDTCLYSHLLPEATSRGIMASSSSSQAPIAPSIGSGQNTAERLAFTSICKYYSKGTCWRDQECTYAHFDWELKPKPDLTRTFLCRKFQRTGHCAEGDSCIYAHSLRELRHPSTSELAGGPAIPSVAVAPVVGHRRDVDKRGKAWQFVKIWVPAVVDLLSATEDDISELLQAHSRVVVAL